MSKATQNLENKSILLVISGGIAAYKSLALIRLIKKSGGRARCILTKGGAQFVTPLSVSALCEEAVYTDLWSLKDETEIGHIRLSREADLIVIAPASANIIAQMAHGLASDLATTTLLAANKPILIAPAMNHQMWRNEATRTNIETLVQRGIQMVGPEDGDMACGEYGPGRMSEPEDIFAAIHNFFLKAPLKGKRALVTSGPTYEPLDPVRFIGNRSSGKQGHAIANALAKAGADVMLVSGPTALPDPHGCHVIHVETAQDMLTACENALPVDIAVCAAAVSDWRADDIKVEKIKKNDLKSPPDIQLQENPDILYTLCTHKNRPTLIIGFAAETENLRENARKKRARKGCDWILANSVAQNDKNVFGADENHVYLISQSGEDDWGAMSKQAIAQRLSLEIADFLEQGERIANAAE